MYRVLPRFFHGTWGVADGSSTQNFQRIGDPPEDLLGASVDSERHHNGASKASGVSLNFGLPHGDFSEP